MTPQCLRLASACLCAALLSALLPADLAAQAATPQAGPTSAQRVEFTRLVAHWIGYEKPEYLTFLEEAQPDIAQVGFYGAHFWSLAHTPHGKGYPAHFPIQGVGECGDWFEKLNAEVHRRKVKVVGHFNVKFLVGDPDSPDGPRGFFKFYRDLWDEKELGPRPPVSSPLDLLEKNADGTPIVNTGYSIGGMKEYWGCLNNPHWLAVLKAWAKRGIERGVDGYVINYFYRHNCLCEHCQREFKTYMGERFKPEELNAQFGISDLDKHQFAEIVSWHKPDESTPLRREMLRFSQVANKRAFDEVFVQYGRKLKPGLLLAQWNHLGNFSQIGGDERCLLPAELWGKDEDYLWYSSGGSAVYTDLAEGFLGDLTLQMRYIRGAFADKPFTMGKYEHTRVRTAIAELAANGGAPMGFYTNFQDPEAREEIVRYYRFIKRYDERFRANRPHAEALLVYPRSLVHQGNVAAVEEFKKLGKQLVDAHVLFDVKPDDLTDPAAFTGYRQVFRFPYAGATLPAGDGFCRFEAPATVVVSASRPAQGMDIDVHFMNYNRIEPEKKKGAGGGIKDEKPIPVEGVVAEIVVPAGFRVARVQAVSPESPEPVNLAPTVNAGRVRFAMPAILIYAVAQIQLEPEK